MIQVKKSQNPLCRNASPGRCLHGAPRQRGESTNDGNKKGVNTMVDPENPGSSQSEAGERIPVMQRVLDNPFLLLFLGVTIPTVLYVIWGVMEIVTIPIAK